MSAWAWLLVAAGIALFLYGLLLAGLLLANRRSAARALGGFIPDCITLCRRLLRDPRVPQRHRILLLGLVAYLALPFDLVPDFIPVLGHLDDALVLAFALRVLLRRAGPALVAEHWPGPSSTLRLVLRLVGTKTSWPA